MANLLAVWEVHGIGDVMRRAWQAGVVLAGVSAGSLCWHTADPTDSFGPELRLQKGLGFLPYGNGVHFDSEPTRRPFVHKAVAAGDLLATYCTDDGASLLYQGTTMVEALAERDSASCYLVSRDERTHAAVEQEMDVRQLPRD